MLPTTAAWVAEAVAGELAGDGAIEVTSWDNAQVAVTVERRAASQAEADALKVDMQQDGNRIVIEAVKPEEEVHIGWHTGRSVAFVVHVPRQTNLTASSGDGATSSAVEKSPRVIRTTRPPMMSMAG